jgi:murein L,D-transpeptidase YafK
VKILERLKAINIGPIKFEEYLTRAVVRNIIYMTIAILLFIGGVVVYGIVLNLRQVTLDQAIQEKGFTKLNSVNLVVDRSTFTINLYEDSTLIKSYRASFGKSLRKSKMRAGDGATPVGEYKICSIDTAYKYYKLFQLNYPNLDDATDALRMGWISQKQFDNIKFQFYYQGCIDYNSALGGNMGIHGIGKFNYILKNLPFVYNWTDGSIAVCDEDLDELYSVIKIGTKVVIR